MASGVDHLHITFTDNTCNCLQKYLRKGSSELLHKCSTVSRENLWGRKSALMIEPINEEFLRRQRTPLRMSSSCFPLPSMAPPPLQHHKRLTLKNPSLPSLPVRSPLSCRASSTRAGKYSSDSRSPCNRASALREAGSYP